MKKTLDCVYTKSHYHRQEVFPTIKLDLPGRRRSVLSSDSYQVRCLFFFNAKFIIKNTQINLAQSLTTNSKIYRIDHTTILEKLCRVCGRMLRTKSVKTVYSCKAYFSELQSTFRIVGFDDPNTHPEHFCHACKVVIDKSKIGYNHRTTVFKGWRAHTEDNCEVCQHYLTLPRGGRQKKARRGGRPPFTSPRYCIERVRELASPPLIAPSQYINTCDVHQHLPLSELKCPICLDILSQPIELVTCGRLMCADCMCKWLCASDHLACPCCYKEHLRDFSTIRD